MRFSEQLDKIGPAFAAAQAEMPHPKRNKTGQVGSQKTKYADMEGVVDTVKPVLAKHGLGYVQSVGGSKGEVTCSTLIIHTSGQWIETDALAIGASGAQAAGSALTYARRYSLMATFGLAPEDDDGKAASPRRQDRVEPVEVLRGSARPTPGSGAVPDPGPAVQLTAAESVRFNALRERHPRPQVLDVAVRKACAVNGWEYKSHKSDYVALAMNSELADLYDAVMAP